MNIRDLKYLVAIADHKHFGQAAAACFVSQPALSMQIKKLENFLGVQLIERTNKSAMLTETGKMLTEHAREILHRVENMKDAARQALDPFSGEIQLGIIPTLAPYLLPRIIPELTRQLPDLSIYLIEDKTPHIMQKLTHGKLDAALLALPLADENFISLPLFEEEFLLAVPDKNSLSKRKNIRLADLQNKPILLLEDGHCLRDQALQVCHLARATETKGFHATSLETLRHMVAANIGMTLMPKLAQQSKDGNYYLPFNAPKPSRVIGLTWRPTSAKRVLLEHMVTLIRKSLRKQNEVKVINTPIPCRKS